MCAVLGLSGLWWLLNVCTCVCVGVCASDQFYADRRMCASVIQTDVCVAVSYRQTCVLVSYRHACAVLGLLGLLQLKTAANGT